MNLKMRWRNLKNKFRMAIQEYVDNYAEKIKRQVKEEKETWINFSKAVPYKMVELMDLSLSRNGENKNEGTNAL